MKDKERLAARARRKAIPEGERAAKAARIANSVLALPEVKAARVVGCYLGVHSEVSTRLLIDSLKAAGKRVMLPEEGIDASAEVVVVPGLAFTARGERLGQGAGYFDRLLRDLPHAFRVGLAFEEQIVEALPTEPHDVPMHVVVTDERVRRV